jgi:hypothetical protein
MKIYLGAKFMWNYALKKILEKIKLENSYSACGVDDLAPLALHIRLSNVRLMVKNTPPPATIYTLQLVVSIGLIESQI